MRYNTVEVAIGEVYLSRFPCCVLLALSWNTNENPRTDKLIMSRAIKEYLKHDTVEVHLVSALQVR